MTRRIQSRNDNTRSLLLLVVEQKKGEKAGQNPEHRAENSEPECEIPARVGNGIGFCFDHFLGFLVSYSPLAAIPKRAACPSNDESN